MYMKHDSCMYDEQYVRATGCLKFDSKIVHNKYIVVHYILFLARSISL